MDACGAGLGVAHLEVPVANLPDGPTVVPCRWRVRAGAPGVFGHPPGIGEGPLGVHVAVAQPTVGGGIRVEVALLDVLPALAVLAREPEQAPRDDGVAPVPQGQRQAQTLLALADPGKAVRAPAEGAGLGLVLPQFSDHRPARYAQGQGCSTLVVAVGRSFQPTPR